MAQTKGDGSPDLFEGHMAARAAAKSAVQRAARPTSAKAAATVARRAGTVKDQVAEFAMEAGKRGFTDDELRLAFPGEPESTYRKRRTELTDSRMIVDSGRVRPNSNGQDATVWQHRLYYDGADVLPEPLNKPPVKANSKPGLRLRVAELEAALETAVKVAEEAREEWDKAPEGMRAGKLIIALSDRSLLYRPDITAMHKARAA